MDKCNRCKRNHPKEAECCYNLKYQQWLLEELERVNNAIESYIPYDARGLRDED